MYSLIIAAALVGLPQAPPVNPGLDPVIKQTVTSAACCEGQCSCCQSCDCCSPRAGETQTELSRADEQRTHQESLQVPDERTEATPRNTLIVHTAPWCGPCRRWKRECLPALRAKGWHIEFRPPDGPIPSFEYREHRWVGYGVPPGAPEWISARGRFMARLRFALRSVGREDA